MRAVEIMLVDKHTLFRKVLRQVLEQEAGVVVVAEAADGWTAQDLAEQLRPDLVVMELCIPLSNGITTSEAITRKCPGTKVIILTMYDEDDWTPAAIEAGAVGCLAKTSSAAQLMAAVLAAGYRPLTEGSD